MYNYAAMNGGFLVGFSMGGYFHMIHNYPLLFALSGLGNVVAVLLCLGSWRLLADKGTILLGLNIQQQQARRRIGLLCVGVLFLALNQLLHMASIANQLVLMAGVVMFVVMLLLSRSQKRAQDRQKIQAFIMLTLAGFVFWILYQLAPMGLNLFISNNVNRQVHWFGWAFDIPPQWFQNINALTIMVGGPAMSMLFRRWRAQGRRIHVPGQFCVALLLIGTAFLLLPLGIYRADAAGYVHPQYILWSYILQSLGELLISPVGYAMVGALIPSSLQGLMTGIWMMSSGVAAILSSYSSYWMTAGVSSDHPLMTNPGYAQVFLILGMGAVLASVCLYLLIPVLKKLIGLREEGALSEPLAKEI